MRRLHSAVVFVTALCWTIICHTTQVSSSGKFQLRLKSFANDRRLNADGDCCKGVRTGGECMSSCSTFFRICLKQYQTHITLDSPCTFGSVTTPVVGNNSFTLPDTLDTFDNPIDLPFDFSWPGTFSLIIEALHDRTSNGPSSGRYPFDLCLITCVLFSPMLARSVGWEEWVSRARLLCFHARFLNAPASWLSRARR
ncbi:Neurogenic locus protein delta [Lamellibrachia satsuma]|nr:Neurogenic locus protein delta [Lamellibrachia satsuma]